MKITAVKNFVTSKAGLKLLVLKKHSPKIMFAAGVVGVAATVVTACRATLKVEEVLHEHEMQTEKITQALSIASEQMYTGTPYSENDARRDTALIYAKTTVAFLKLYGPSVVLGVASIALLTGAHVVLSRRNVAVTAAYAALDKGFREYRQRVSDELGPDKEQELRYGLVDHEATDELGNTKIEKRHPSQGKYGSIYARLWDEISSSSYTPEEQMGHLYNPIFLRTQQQYANDKLRANGWLLLNDVYEMLGLAKTKEGCVVGWVLDGGNSDNYVDFGVFEGDQIAATQFVTGNAPGIWLDFNVDGVIYDKI